MAGGDGATAVRHAEAAVDLATATESARHRTKSKVVLAAALCSAGNVDRARAVGEGALELTGELGLRRCAGRWRPCWSTSRYQRRADR